MAPRRVIMLTFSPFTGLASLKGNRLCGESPRRLRTYRLSSITTDDCCRCGVSCHACWPRLDIRPSVCSILLSPTLFTFDGLVRS